MKPPKAKRAPRGTPSLTKSPSGYWAIRWSARHQAQFGAPSRESTGERDRERALQVLYRRTAELCAAHGDKRGAAEARERVRAPALPELLLGFLRSFAAGDLTPERPSARTQKRISADLLAPNGLGAFAKTHGEQTFSERLVKRWIEARRDDTAPGTRRLMLISARHVARHAAHEGFISDDTLRAIAALPMPKQDRSRVHRFGVPTREQVGRFIKAISPEPFQALARAQLAIGCRMSEIANLRSAWIDRPGRRVTIPADASFRGKGGEKREIDGLSDEALALVERAATEIKLHKLNPGSYAAAAQRAARRLRAAGEWPFESTTHALRQFHAVASLSAGVPAHTVSRRLGHASLQITVASYVGRQQGEALQPFVGIPEPPRLRVVGGVE